MSKEVVLMVGDARLLPARHAGPSRGNQIVAGQSMLVEASTAFEEVCKWLEFDREIRERPPRGWEYHWRSRRERQGVQERALKGSHRMRRMRHPADRHS